ncbi:MAG: hypothetical protein ACRCUE_05730 [Bosea sp. (in: a-proteobacteria)]
MPTRSILLAMTCLALAGCQTIGAEAGRTELDQQCAQGKLASRALSKVTGFALGMAGVPAGGLAGRAVGYVTDPNCDLGRPVAAPAPPRGAVRPVSG